MAIDFEESIAKVSTIADGSVPLDSMKNSIMELSNETGIASTEIANNVYDAISAGQKTGDAVNFVSNSTKLAKAGFADAGSALDILTTTMNAYGMEASEVGRVSDVLIQTQNLGKTTVAELSSSMGKIIPTAKSAGVGLEQVASGYAVMTANGIATAESTTYMNSMINELNKSSSVVSKTLKDKTGKGFSELMESGSSLADVMEILSDSAADQGKKFGDLWGSAEAGKAALTILGDGADNFNNVLGQMNNATGSTDKAFDKLQTNGNTIQKTLNTVKNTGIELGGVILEMLSPSIEKVADKVSQLSKWFHNLDEDSKKTIVKFAGIAAAAGPLLLGVGKITAIIGGTVSSFGKLGGALVKFNGTAAAAGGGVGKLGAKFAPLIAKIAPFAPVLIGVAAAAVLVYKNFDKIKDFASKMGAKIKSALAGSGNSIESIKEKLSGVVEKCGPIVDKLGTVFGKIGEKLQPALDFVSSVFEAGIVAAFENIANRVSGVIDAIGTVMDGFTTMLDGVIMILDGDFKGGFKKVFEGLGGIVYGALSGLPAIVKTPINAVIALANKAISGINGLALDIPDWVPLVGGKHIGFSIPQIPMLYKGTDNWKGGPAIINEKTYGGEIVDLPKGTRVYPHDESVRMAKNEGRSFVVNIPKLADQIIVREDADIDRITDELVRKIEKIVFDMP